MSSPTRYQAVLFDFGGVITESPFDAFARYEAEAGLPGGFIRSVNATNPDTNAWARLERSEVTIGEFADLFESEARSLGHEVDAKLVLRALTGRIRPAMVEAVRRIGDAGLTTACLTNNIKTGHRPDTEADDRAGDDEGRDERRRVLALFDHVVESSKLGVRKPEAEFYRAALDLIGVAPTEAIFLDDLGINLKPARAMGIATIKVLDPDEALRRLGHELGLDLT